MVRPVTPAGARRRDLILAYPAATYPEIAEIAEREGLPFSRSQFGAVRGGLRKEGYTLPDLPRGHPAQSRNRPQRRRKRPAVVYPRDERKRCPLCRQLLPDERGS